jgi:hypothetical protein
LNAAQQLKAQKNEDDMKGLQKRPGMPKAQKNDDLKAHLYAQFLARHG